MSVDVAAVLRAARAKIEEPGHWIQGHMAVDADGIPTSPNGPHVAKWCAAGALRAALDLNIDEGSVDFRTCRRWLEHAIEKIEPASDRNIVNFNDYPYRTHDVVLAVFDEAIARATESQ